MEKKFKLKNFQLGKGADLEKLKAKLAGEKEPKKEKEREKEKEPPLKKQASTPVAGTPAEEKPRRRAKTRSSFEVEEELREEEASIALPQEEASAEEIEVESPILEETPLPLPPVAEAEVVEEIVPSLPEEIPLSTPADIAVPEVQEEVKATEPQVPEVEIKEKPKPIAFAKGRLGPTGRHIRDLLPPPKPPKPKETRASTPPPAPAKEKEKEKEKVKEKVVKPTEIEEESEANRKKKKVREFRDLKPKAETPFKPHAIDEDERWRKKRGAKRGEVHEEVVTRPTSLKVRLPITVKDLASEMKLKVSQLIAKLFMQGITLTLNDILDDETMVQFLGAEFGCEITIDRTLSDRIQIVKETVDEEIEKTGVEELKIRPPVITFMGHVDHGKTSLIDYIRKSNVAAGEAGAITQHMGAFRCKTAVGDITILDTPGHEAFSAMRERGATVTDIVVLVVAGDEGMRDQTYEALEHAKKAGVTIMVAINKCDKPNFNAENVYRQLSEVELLPEVWGGQTITVNTSATTGQGIKELLEMLALQAEIMELKANPSTRARGIVLESELHKGLGAVATILVQNGTLRVGDAIVLDYLWGRIKTMQDEYGKKLTEAGPSTPVEITGLSGTPKAGDSFIVVKSEKEAREIAEMRAQGMKEQALLQKKAPTMESLMAQEEKKEKKVLKVVIRTDVQGSLEALKASLLKIKSKKVDLDIVYGGIGEIAESDVELALASHAVILGFHSQVESKAAQLAKEKGIVIRLHDIIYHAVDDVKELMKGLLDKIEEEQEQGRATVKALFKVSNMGTIAGCVVTEGSILRNLKIKVERNGAIIWKGSILSLKRVKEDVREVKKGLECGILLDRFNEFEVGDTLIAFDIIYHTQEI